MKLIAELNNSVSGEEPENQSSAITPSEKEEP